MKVTQLNRYHVQNAKLTEFAGYEMPLWYTSIQDEHLAVRNGVGLFDVSHMGRIQISGEGAGRFLESLLPTQVLSQPAGKSFYTLLLSENGGILDDLVVLKLVEGRYLAVVNAVNTEKDLKHMRDHAQRFDASVDDVTSGSAMVAVQGPTSQATLQPLTDLSLSELKRFRCAEALVNGQPCIISRTGYTGEDGFEVLITGATIERPGPAEAIWERLSRAAKPCGLGARDSLRIEAGYPLWGLDIGERTDPYQADLTWVVSKGKTGYVGYEAVSRAAQTVPSELRRGVTVESGIPRPEFEVMDSEARKIGRVTSGTFSPVLRRGIAICMLSGQFTQPGAAVSVMIRESPAKGRVVRTPFYDETVFGWKRNEKGK